MSDQRLFALAQAAGLSIDWVDADGRPQQATPEVLRAVLAGLGHAANSPTQVEESLRELEQLDDRASLPPLLTLDQGQPLDLSRHFAPGAAFELLQEDGSRIDARLDDQGRLPAFAGIGYHHLRIADRELTLAVAPSRCHSLRDALQSDRPNAWGLGVQLYALRRNGDGGIGDTQALETLAHSAAAHGADALAISPLHAMFSADTYRFSPYSPSSRLFFNVLHSAPGSILGEYSLRQAIEAAGLVDELRRLESLDLIDWPAAAQTKLRLLRTLYDEFRRGGHPLHEDFASFRHAGGEALENHCRFEALHAFHARDGVPRDWHQWPDAYRDPRNPAVARFAAEHADEVAFHAFAQWLVARGLERTQTAARTAGMRIGLIADLAVGADGGGSQAWSRQAELLSALTVGAPPDILNRAGQSWGISAFSPEGLKRHGYHAFIEMIRANLAHAGGLRIDHVMGLKRLWVMPAGAGPEAGAYLSYPLPDLLRLLCLESWRHKAVILGEDLGTVPEGFREHLIARDILGIRVLLFEHDWGWRFRPPQAWPDNALATTTTHDLPTLHGWWIGRDLDWLGRLGQLDEAGLHAARASRAQEREGLARALAADAGAEPDQPIDDDTLLDRSAAFIGHTPAPLVLLPMEDALGLVEQPNLPGTVDSHPNWRRRWPDDCHHLLEAEGPARRLRLLDQARKRDPS